MLSALTVLALAVAAQAAPAEVAGRATKSFSLPAVHNGAARNGTASLLKAYKKFNLTPSQEFSDSFLAELQGSNFKKQRSVGNARRQDGSVTASPDPNDVEYLVQVSIGGQNLNLDFDTGSADLWVFSSLLPSADQSGHNIYNSKKSSTYQASSGETWSISYGDGSSASGVVGTDTVTVGETVVEGQVVELAKKISSEFVSSAGDGLLGLAFSSINTVTPDQASTFFDNAQSGLDSPLFAAYLPKDTDGSYDFGETDSSKYSGDITYTSVDSSNGFWEYPSESFSVNGQSGSQSGYTGITDTGTTLLLTSDAAVSAYYAAVDGATYSSNDGGYVFDCSATLPDFSFAIGDNTATVSGSVINFAPGATSGQCFGGIQSVGGGTQAIYGDVFLNSNYGVFNADGPQFGFAPFA